MQGLFCESWVLTSQPAELVFVLRKNQRCRRTRCSSPRFFYYCCAVPDSDIQLKSSMGQPIDKENKIINDLNSKALALLFLFPEEFGIQYWTKSFSIFRRSLALVYPPNFTVIRKFTYYYIIISLQYLASNLTDGLLCFCLLNH